MSYIGKSPQTGAYNMLDTLTASATASYSLTLDSVAFVPESANHLIVSLNGTIQKAGSSYNVSGSTLTFSSTLASSDAIDFVLALGNVLDIGTPSDATVTNAKTNFVSTSSAAGLQIKGDGTTDGTLQLNCSQNSHGVKIKSPAHSASASYTLTLPTTDGSASEFLQTDGSGVLSWASAGGNTPAFMAIKTPNQSVSANTSTTVTFNSEIFDSDGKYDTSTSRFTPTVAGKYLLFAQLNIQAVHDQSTTEFDFKKNNSNVMGRYKHIALNSSSDREPSLHSSIIVDADADDYFTIVTHTDMGSGTTITGDGAGFTYFGAFKIGGA